MVAITTTNMLNNTHFLETDILMIRSLINEKTSDAATWVSPMRYAPRVGPRAALGMAEDGRRQRLVVEYLSVTRRTVNKWRRRLSRNDHWKTDLTLADPQQWAEWPKLSATRRPTGEVRVLGSWQPNSPGRLSAIEEYCRGK